eukprot:9459035-Pyramimonas_sp.AAC.1
MPKTCSTNALPSSTLVTAGRPVELPCFYWSPPARVECRKTRALLKITRTLRIVSRFSIGQQTEFRALD